MKITLWVLATLCFFLAFAATWYHHALSAVMFLLGASVAYRCALPQPEKHADQG